MTMTFSEIIPVINAHFEGEIPNICIDNIVIDSRSLQNGNQTLFFAIVGPHHDAHQYIETLISKGVTCFVVSYIPNGLQNKAHFLLVQNTLTALQQFAAFYRNQYHFPVVGITGSNGKTIVKEWLNFLLTPDYNIIRSPKSYNSQVGVPLSVLAINENHNFGIFEAGISTVFEMQHLQKIINPNIGILTNIGPAHDEGFNHNLQKISEKMVLFKNAEVVIFQKNKDVEAALTQKNKSFTWSLTDRQASVFIQKNDLLYTFFDTNDQKMGHLQMPFTDEASTENVISCIMLLLYLKYDFQTIQKRISLLFPLEMRLTVKKGIENATLIDDSYSSDFQSLKIALDFMENHKQGIQKTVILSDIYQSGLPEKELYLKVAQLLSGNQITRLIGIGKTIETLKPLFKQSVFYESTETFLRAIKDMRFQNETILIKGARRFEFEKIVAALEEKTHETVLEINLNAISHNLNYYKTKLKPTTKLMAMVKAFGYGNGGFEIAKLLEHHKVDYLGVAFADEGIALKNAGIKLPIMVLNPESTSFLSLIQYGLEPEIYSFRGLHSFLEIARHQQLLDYPIHIKLDTGMHRLGFQEPDLTSLIAILEANNAVKVQSILSHLATSDDLDSRDFAQFQIQLFEKCSSMIMQKLKIQPIRHVLNTSGISNYTEAQYDMVRLGIGLYGISNDPNEQPLLAHVGTLKSIISQIRTIYPGESVGYSRRFIAQKPTTIATIPIGYADGISRLWGNGVGYVTINQQKASIVGSICMDMLMVDITDINCLEGDNVIIIGQNPSAILMAKALQTIPYEILTSISQRVKRVFYRE
ncbi:bifunctional UDP-N-acetylmuramoyl-tripeptide:D-alanyl-D-alanine ligase/alanine racemase [Flavobacterium branchiophilum]|uniref:Alanine racemase n=1 Tax=Flavobacterium branchiophilum TaxID=55197 RepID=A0A2H3L256_9FLAO|nr:bifunctional UDP-N-acetylmuramoyl-tripeptide:D-alanyl-D-alanine ligase/alanine racemase [Flavobacterium branchiophilum]PDS27087.1 bifunctional UDP-N-acetylmuramoyl-tripeptide:D-alanyl-D-alanine ligase/alanine racemase [Flavobacterium branchiophilum]